MCKCIKLVLGICSNYFIFVEEKEAIDDNLLIITCKFLKVLMINIQCDFSLLLKFLSCLKHRWVQNKFSYSCSINIINVLFGNLCSRKRLNIIIP